MSDQEDKPKEVRVEMAEMPEKKSAKKKKGLSRGQSRALSWANSSKFFTEELTLNDVASQMSKATTALELGVHSYRFHKYSNTFTGSKAVNWFLSNNFADNVVTAVQLGNEMLEGELFFAIAKNTVFRDDNSLYFLPNYKAHDEKKEYKKFSKVRKELVNFMQKNIETKQHKYRNIPFPETFYGEEGLKCLSQWLEENDLDSKSANAWSAFLISDRIIAPVAPEGRSRFKLDNEDDDVALYSWIELSPKTANAVEKFDTLVEQLESEEKGIKVEKQKIGTKVFPKAFNGAELVKWLVKNDWSSGAQDAIELGNILQLENVIVSALGDIEFDDDAQSIFRLNRDIEAKKKLQDASGLENREVLQAVLPLSDHQVFFTLYPDSFSGSEGVEALIAERYATDREDAVEALNNLAKKSYIRCISAGKREHPSYEDKGTQIWTLLSETAINNEKLKKRFPGNLSIYDREVLKKGPQAKINKATFARMFDIHKDNEAEFLNGVFRVFANNENEMDREQFDNAVHTLFEEGEFIEKLRFLFLIMDKENSGSVSRSQVDELITTSTRVNGFRLSKEKIQQLTDLVLENLGLIFDTEDGRHEKLEYEEVLKTKTRRLNAQNQSQRVKFQAKASKFAFSTKSLGEDKKKKKIKKDNSDKLFETGDAHPPSFASYWYLEKVKWTWMIMWFFSNLFLFAGGFMVYSIGSKQEEFYVLGWGLPVAKAFSYTIYMNASLILIFISRWYLTILQDYWIAHYLPLHKNIVFHRYTALAMMLASYSHGMAHLWDVWVVDGLNTRTITGILTQGQFDRNPGYIVWALGTIPGLTGIIIVVSQSLILITAVYKEWRRAHFDIFWYTHQFYIPFYVCIGLHGLADLVAFPIYWCFLLFPAFTFTAERMRRLYRQIVGAKVYSAIYNERTEVLLLQFEKPKGLRYKAGMFVFLNWRSEVTQWHPFTLTSSPLEEHMSVAMKKLGDWTKAIALAFQDVEQDPEKLSKMVPIAVDGPYGAPAEEFFEYKYVMLVGAGIGITPFASITKDIFLRKKRVEKALKAKAKSARDLNQPLDLQAQQDDDNALKNLKKVYLFWLNPNAESFLWFADLLRDIDNYQGMFKNSTYITRATNQSDVRNWFLNTGLNLDFEKTKTDAITGLKTRTFWGRPDWDKIFEKMSSNYRDELVGVFFCGAPVISKELRRMCEKYTNTSGGARFDYLKENF